MDKVQSLVTSSRDPKDLLQCDVAEDPDYVMEQGLKLNYLYYLEKQLEKPLISLFEILIDDADHMFDRQKMGVHDIRKWFGGGKTEVTQEQTVMRKKIKPKTRARSNNTHTQTNTLMKWLQPPSK